MILSNVDIAVALESGLVRITPTPQTTDLTKSPYNTSSIDLHLADEISVPKTGQPVSIDMAATGGAGLARYLAANSDARAISDEQP